MYYTNYCWPELVCQYSPSLIFITFADSLYLPIVTQIINARAGETIHMVAMQWPVVICNIQSRGEHILPLLVYTHKHQLVLVCYFH
jgi:hypothetical protein